MNNWYKLSKIKIRKSIVFKLMNFFRNYDDMFNYSIDFFIKKFNLKDEYVKEIFRSKNIDLKEDIEKYQKEKIRIICLNDDEYPYLLKNISNPPLFLFIKGKIDIDQKTIGLVGTRKITSYGKSSTEKLCKGLVESGVTIVSGLANGVDAVAHNQTLVNRGKTIAVVGSGLDVIYPYENKRLWNRIEEEGLIISEYPLGTPPNRWNFPERNRIIVGLSKGIVITESFAKGGSLITGKLCLDENRELFAVPGFISYPSSEGCNNLIKTGEAKLVTEVDDILDEFGWDKKIVDIKELSFDLNNLEKKIYKVLIGEKNLDQLILETKLRATDLLVLITEMEIKGIVKSVSGGKYRKCI